MVQRVTKGLADFEWAAVAHYTVYIESAARLAQVSDAQIYNFPVGRMGVDQLIAHKRRIKHIIEANLSNLATYVGRWDTELTDEEKVILRSYYRTIKNTLEIVEGHLETAKAIKQFQQQSVFDNEEVSEDELPF